MTIRKMHLFFVLASIFAAAPFPASAQGTKIEVPADKKWQHAATGLIVPQSLAGLPRGTITDNSASEIDVAVQFAGADSQLTLYIFRPSFVSVPVWFDRVETQVLLSERYGNPSPTTAPTAFAPPGSVNASGLRRVYRPGKPPYSATGSVVLPIGEWLVAIRLTSSTLDPEQLDAKLSEAVAGLGWNAIVAGTPPAPIAEPVQPCANSLGYAKKAKPQKPDLTSALIGAAIVSAAQDPKNQVARSEPAIFCREGTPTSLFGVYRANTEKNGYTIAIADAGRTVAVFPGFNLGKGDGGYQVRLDMLDKSLVYPNFDKLPTPELVMDMLQHTAPVSSTSRDGKSITLQAK